MKNVGRRLLIGSMAGILVAAYAGISYARNTSKTRTRHTDVSFSNNMALRNGETLPAGTYRMDVPENSQNPVVTFEKDGKVVATSKANVVSEEKKNEETEIDSVRQGQAQLITEIRPSGWNEALVFGSNGK
jgi:hypothetical protein